MFKAVTRTRGSRQSGKSRALGPPTLRWQKGAGEMGRNQKMPREAKGKEGRPWSPTLCC